jgi:dinuclear metal center YbgI/SA1388 family protein
MKIFEIEEYLNSILKPEEFSDYCHNGIQVECDRDIKKVAVGVSFNFEFAKKALENGADLLLVHHGIFGKDFFSLKGFLKKRVGLLIKNDIGLIGYHLPLDAHPVYGNNASIMKKLGINDFHPFEVGFKGEFSPEVPFDEFLEKMSRIIPRDKFIYYKNNDYVKKIGVLSGGGSAYMNSLENEIDTYLTGEVKEHVRDMAKEMKINFINCGHYSTETFGVKNLATLLEDKFNLETFFIDYYNEV